VRGTKKRLNSSNITKHIATCDVEKVDFVIKILVCLSNIQLLGITASQSKVWLSAKWLAWIMCKWQGWMMVIADQINGIKLALILLFVWLYRVLSILLLICCNCVINNYLTERMKLVNCNSLNNWPSFVLIWIRFVLLKYNRVSSVIIAIINVFSQMHLGIRWTNSGLSVAFVYNLYSLS